MNLSKNAQTIMEKVEAGKKLSEVLKENPELLEGVDEYSEYILEQGKIAGKPAARAKISHSLKQVIKKLSSKK